MKNISDELFFNQYPLDFDIKSIFTRHAMVHFVGGSDKMLNIEDLEKAGFRLKIAPSFFEFLLDPLSISVNSIVYGTAGKRDGVWQSFGKQKYFYSDIIKYFNISKYSDPVQIFLNLVYLLEQAKKKKGLLFELKKDKSIFLGQLGCFSNDVESIFVCSIKNKIGDENDKEIDYEINFDHISFTSFGPGSLIFIEG